MDCVPSLLVFTPGISRLLALTSCPFISSIRRQPDKKKKECRKQKNMHI